MDKPYGYASVSMSGIDRSAGKDLDLEMGVGEATLYPGLSYGENQLRWGFIRKVYGILSAQLLLTTLISAVVALNPPVNDLLTGSPGILLFLCIVPFILIWPLHIYHQKHPVNLILLALFTVSLSFTVGVSCAMTEGRIVLQALILTLSVVGSLTAYTFWAAKRGHDFNFLGPFLFSAVMVLILFSLIQIFFPLGKISEMIYGGLASLVFSGYIIYDTDNIIKRYTYDEYVWAAVSLYLDVINLFLALLRVLRAADN